ncbi:MAG: endonuclease/exonuclease/phosphatase family protein [Thermoleophilaceae bacterium]
MAVVLTWNVQGRVGDWQERQVEALATRDFDVLCLQEVTPGNRERWEQALTAMGFHVAVSGWPVEPRGSRRFAVLVASRAPLEVVQPPALPWQERHLAVRTALDGTDVEVHTLHAPLSGKEEQVKVRTLEALHEALAAPAGLARVLAGDFNTPQYESRDGEIQTFARTRGGNIRPRYGERHDRAELLLIEDLPRRGWRDAFRAVHGYARRDRSWVAAVKGYGYRLDHIIVSAELEPIESDYVHEWREAGMSDHSAMWAEIRPAG